MPAPDIVVELVNRFHEQNDSYRQSSYNGTLLRRDFIDPLFVALGWDIDNKQGHAEAYREVIHKDSIKIGGSTKAPDYCFRVGPVRKFFLESKKPSVNISKDPAPAFQLRRYGWSAKLPLSILTDFEEFAVYDTRIKPSKTDKASTARIKFLKFDQYVERWDEIADVFSREAILNGAFDKFADTNKKKRGTAEVDDVFLKDIEEWRTLLAKDVVKRNKDLDQRSVNTAVQTTIDRIIFLRICEDRGIEKYGRLQALLNGPKVYARLGQLFEQADDRYHSGLFHFHKDKDRDVPPDEWTLSLTVDDKPLKQILKHLYYPDSPYEFSVLGADILGQVYEQFLGKVIVLTKSHQAKIEEKPEVKKAGGIYYTPTYIVDYIVQQTVGELVKGKPPHEVAGRTQTTFKPAKGKHPITVLDLACGSGSFLIGAYQFLLDWYLEQYIDGGPADNKDHIYQAGRDDWRLTTAERKRILLDHIYGVDLDAQAVEVTKLSLLLKVLEGENQQTLDRQLFHKERALPDLGNNIKCGNSLIDPDFYDGRQLELQNEDERARINAFDWEAEFAEILNGEGSGFDAVIGNPPYLSYSGRQAVPLEPRVRDYFQDRYPLKGWQTAHGYFIMQAIALTRRMLGLIVPDQVGHLEGYESVRSVLTRDTHVANIRYWGEKVFEGAVTPALTLVADKGSEDPTRITTVSGDETTRQVGAGQTWLPVSLQAGLIDKLRRQSKPLDEAFADIGVHTGNCSKKLIQPVSEGSSDSVPVLEGKLVGRYVCRVPTKVLELNYGAERDEYFTIRPVEKYRSAPFVMRQTAAYPIVGPRCHADYFRNSLLALYPPADGRDVRLVVAILNSRLMRYVYSVTVREAGQKAFPQVKVRSLRALPIRAIDFDDATDRDAHEALVGLVDAMIDLQRRREEVKVEHDRNRLSREIDACDQEINRTVEELYGLTTAEIEQIETFLNEESTSTSSRTHGT